MSYLINANKLHTKYIRYYFPAIYYQIKSKNPIFLLKNKYEVCYETCRFNVDYNYVKQKLYLYQIPCIWKLPCVCFAHLQRNKVSEIGGGFRVKCGYARRISQNSGKDEIFLSKKRNYWKPENVNLQNTDSGFDAALPCKI